IPALGLAGFSITRPYKVEILPYLSQIEELAAACGSVNTVVMKGGSLLGSSTDGAGVLVPLAKRLDVDGRNVVIVGAGGAARGAGCRTIGGLEMLLAQAEGQFKAWTGAAPPSDAMREAVLTYLEEQENEEESEESA